MFSRSAGSQAGAKQARWGGAEVLKDVVSWTCIIHYPVWILFVVGGCPNHWCALWYWLYKASFTSMLDLSHGICWTAMTFCAVFCSKLTGQMFIFQGMYVENLTSDCVIYRTRLHCLFVDQVISETFSWEGSFCLTSLDTKCLISTWFNML